MTDDRTKQEDLETQDGEPLPDREVMSIITPEPQPWPAPDGEQSQPVEEPPTTKTPQEPLRGGESG